MAKRIHTRMVTETREDGKKYAKFITEYVEEKPMWGDNYRNTHKTDPTEKAPSFKSKW